MNGEVPLRPNEEGQHRRHRHGQQRKACGDRRLFVYRHWLRHSLATTLLERRTQIELIEKFFGHSKLETTQVYAESTTEMIKDGYRRALAE